MRLAVQALEVVLLISTLAYLSLMLAALSHRNGRIWSVFQIHAACSFLFSLGLYVGLRVRVFRPYAENPILTAAVLGLIGLPRLVDAVADVIIALHLRKPDGGVPPPDRIREPLVLHRRRAE